MSRTALILGGTGLAGRGIAAELLAADWTVSNLARGTTPSGPRLSFAESLAADRRSVPALTAALAARRYDLVVDCSAYTRDDVAAVQTALAGRCGHYFFLSTDFVYAPDPTAFFPLTEEAPKLSGYDYATDKLAAEALLTVPPSAGAAAFPATVLRPPHILGAGKPAGCAPPALRDPQLAEKLHAGQPLSLLAHGEYLIQPVWSRELGRCIAHLAGRHETHGQIYTCAGADVVTTRRYFEIVAELAGAPAPKILGLDPDGFRRTHPADAHFARHRLYDLSRLRATGFTPTLRLADALRETLFPCAA